MKLFGVKILHYGYSSESYPGLDDSYVGLFSPRYFFVMALDEQDIITKIEHLLPEDVEKANDAIGKKVWQSLGQKGIEHAFEIFVNEVKTSGDGVVTEQDCKDALQHFGQQPIKHSLPASAGWVRYQRAISSFHP